MCALFLYEIKHTFDSMYFLKECICVDLHTVCLCVFHTLYVLKID